MRIFLVPFASERAHIERETGLFVGFEHRRYAVHGRTGRRFLKARCLDDASRCAGEGQVRVAPKGHRWSSTLTHAHRRSPTVIHAHSAPHIDGTAGDADP